MSIGRTSLLWLSWMMMMMMMMTLILLLLHDNHWHGTHAASFHYGDHVFRRHHKLCGELPPGSLAASAFWPDDSIMETTAPARVYPFCQDDDRPFLEAIASLSALPHDGACRIFHGRGGCYASFAVSNENNNQKQEQNEQHEQHAICQHITLDWYGPVFVLTTFVEVADEYLKHWQQALEQQWKRLTLYDSSFGATRGCVDPVEKEQTLNLVYQCRVGNNVKNVTTTILSGQVPSPTHVVSENGLRYKVHVLKGQNHGLFLDMANGRTWVRENAAKSNVLNLFAYTCAFSVCAVASGARQVVNVDMSKSALKIGQQNHGLNPQPNYVTRNQRN